MMDFLEFALDGFWRFVGVVILLFGTMSTISHFLIVIWNRFWRHWNIRKHGYPPSHCDADGDFKPLKDN